MTVRRREYNGVTGRPAWSYDFCQRGARYRKAGFETKAEAQIAEADARQRAKDAAPRRRSRTAMLSTVIEEFIAYLRAKAEFQDRLSDIANGAFAKGFSKGLRS